ncbi:MAG: SpoIIE family protein phosphatase [Bacteroidales bacterium]|nr:SpoIIE family protein phosphatase [Bacteroidales bacterium]
MKLKSVQTGVLLAAIVAIVLMLLCLGGYYFYQSSELKKQSEASKKDRALLVKRLLSVSTEKYLQPVKDNSAWDDLYNAVKDIDTATIDECVGYMPETYQSGCVAVFDADGNKIYDSHIPDFPTNIFPFDGKDLIEFFSDSDRTTFTVNIDGRLFNYIGAGIVPTDDEYTRQTPPIGYILLIREVLELDIKLHCKALGEIDAEMFLAEGEKNDYIKTLDNVDYVESTMRNHHGEVSAYLCFSYLDPAAGQIRQFARVFNFICVEIVLILVLVLLFVNKNITRPLRRINKAFEQDQIAPVSSLTNMSNEFGQIARMMYDFFEQKEEITSQNDALKLQKEEIEMQNECMMDLNDSLTKTNQQMTDSITYARRLQQSMLHAHAPKDGWFSESFAIYIPKNIVGGDFYVCQTVGVYNIAIDGDCTGHGVPGAMLASMGISFLYQIIDSSDFDFMPDTLLNRMRTKVIDAFGTDEEGRQVSDGMDVGVVIYNKETSEAYFAGAGRPAVIVHDGAIQLVKGDHMPIGRYVKTNDFTRHKLDLQAGDIVYIYSDGCTDQVGGPQMRKITATKFKDYLLEISGLDFPAQKETIENYIKTWRGDIPQTDDISLLAFRV